MEPIEQILSVFFTALILIYSSWITLFFYTRRKDTPVHEYPPISIIVPAHDEEKYIQATVQKLLDASYPAEREIIVVNDGSKDRTRDIVLEMSKRDNRISIIDTAHAGKSNAINTGARQSKNELLVVLDADSIIEQNALQDIVRPLGSPAIAAASGVIRAVITRNPLTWFQDFEYVIGSAWRHVYNNINSTYVLPVFVAIRKKALLDIGGFGTNILSEDVDLGIRLRKAGFQLTMSNATLYTKVPLTLVSLAKQRIRWSRGIVQTIRAHKDVPFNLQYGAVGLYGIPLQIYWFIHGLIVIPLTLYQIFDGYMRYFVTYNNYLTFNAFKYFFGWISAYGMVEYTYRTFIGQYPMTPFFILVLTTFILNLAYNLLAMAKFSGFRIRHFFVLFFFFPYSLFVLIVYLLPAIHETLFGKIATAKWEKNY
ncbi:MAG: glycosyltransferase [Candidatus Altiarchaeota archaeon]|nr:glycosyltransferase [Candidatus Altiarchaeota archaeon]